MVSPLISTDELATRLNDPMARVLDVSWYLGDRDAREEFDRGHIPGAVFAGLEPFCDPDADLPHMLAPTPMFAQAMSRLGVGADDTIVVYDGAGLFAAARAWWSLKVMGARDVRVLDGGFPTWRAEGRPIETGIGVAPQRRPFIARFDPTRLADRQDVSMAIADGDQVIDARSPGRFHGREPEPRAGLRTGHIAGSLNLPFDRLLTDGKLLRGSALATAVTEAGIDPGVSTITTCGSGVTAAIVNLAFAELGCGARLYDGSWAEWGRPDGGPISTG